MESTFGEGGCDFDKLSESDKGVVGFGFGDVGCGEAAAAAAAAEAEAAVGWFLRWGSMDEGGDNRGWCEV